MQIEKALETENSDVASLSYKFQRLREKLRKAVADGELSGKLPGERTLAKKFHVNAKTLSKALTDLAAEGLLDRSIGRGTYVKGTAPVVTSAKRWLVLCDPRHVHGEVLAQTRSLHADLEIVTDLDVVRPSFINQFSAVIDLSSQSRDGLIRDLVVRNIPVVVVGEKPYTYSTHAVQSDLALSALMAGRDLLLAGHRRIAAVEPQHRSVVATNLRTAAARFAPDVTVDACFADDVPAMIDAGVTSFVCSSCDEASRVKAILDRLGVGVPSQVSLMAIGSAVCDPPCSGYFIPTKEKATAIVQLLGDAQNARPTTIWLACRFVDRKTVGPITGLPREHTHHYREMAG